MARLLMGGDNLHMTLGERVAHGAFGHDDKMVYALGENGDIDGATDSAIACSSWRGMLLAASD